MQTSAGDLDTEIVQREDTSAVPLRGPEDPMPSRAMIEAHNLTHLRRPLRGAKSVSKPEGKVIGTSKSSTTVRFRVCRRISSSSLVSLCGVPRHKPEATVLTMVDMDSGYVGVLMVSGKSPDNFAVRSSSSFVDKLRAEEKMAEIARREKSQCEDVKHLTSW